MPARPSPSSLPATAPPRWCWRAPAPPHHKVCGEFLSEEAQALLAYLGLDLHGDGRKLDGHVQARGGESLCRGAAPVPRRRSTPAIASTRRLLDKAEAAGAEVRRGVTVTEVTSGDGEVGVKAGAETLKARAVALSSGKHNLRQFPRAPSDMVGFKLQLRVSASALWRGCKDIVQLMMFDGGYIGAMHRRGRDRHDRLGDAPRAAPDDRRGLAVPGRLSRRGSPSFSPSCSTAPSRNGRSRSRSPPFLTAIFAAKPSRLRSSRSATSSP